MGKKRSGTRLVCCQPALLGPFLAVSGHYGRTFPAFGELQVMRPILVGLPLVSERVGTVSFFVDVAVVAGVLQHPFFLTAVGTVGPDARIFVVGVDQVIIERLATRVGFAFPFVDRLQ